VKGGGLRLRASGATLFSTQPDAMWIYIHETEYVDVICVEVCNSRQNLNDKRSRYGAAVHSLVIECSRKWLVADIPTTKGSAPRWQACRSISAAPQQDVRLPVRFLRVLFSLPPSLYKRWANNYLPAGHEFFCEHVWLRRYRRRKMQSFLERMSVGAQFLTPFGS
jgi:hypothetical protein